MMKIHTTQNLANSTNSQSANMYVSNVLKNSDFSEKMLRRERMYSKNDNVSFKGSKKKFIEHVANSIKSAAGKEKKWIDKVLTSGTFDRVLDMMNHEVFIQAAISCLICVILRPLTIMSLPSKKDKNDNRYASAHSIASGMMGLASSLLISIPFSKGIKYAQKNLMQNLKEDILKEMHPKLDLKSIWKDAGQKVRKPMEEWKDIYGNTFSSEYKSVMTVAKGKHISKMSEETLKTFGIDVDLAAQKDLKFSEMVDRKGNKIYDQFKLKDMFIEIEEEGMGKNLFSLKHVNEEFLADTFKDLEIKSIKDSAGNRLHPKNWKTKKGEEFMPDLLDHIHLSSYRETCESMPLYTGKIRVEKDGTKKYCSYQANVEWADKSVVPEKLGTEIDQTMLDADLVNDVKTKTLGWIPDILSRPLVASSTIALLPMILKNVFGLEKGKKPAPAPVQVSTPVLETRKVVA